MAVVGDTLGGEASFEDAGYCERQLTCGLIVPSRRKTQTATTYRQNLNNADKEVQGLLLLHNFTMSYLSKGLGGDNRLIDEETIMRKLLVITTLALCAAWASAQAVGGASGSMGKGVGATGSTNSNTGTTGNTGTMGSQNNGMTSTTPDDMRMNPNTGTTGNTGTMGSQNNGTTSTTPDDMRMNPNTGTTGNTGTMGNSMGTMGAGTNSGDGVSGTMGTDGTGNGASSSRTTGHGK